MAHWLVKSGIQRVISWLPASWWWYEQFQLHVTRSIVLSEQAFEGKLGEAARFLDRFRRHQSGAPESFTALEVGTGWYPTLPLSFYLCGASEIFSFDITPHLNRSRLELVLRYFCRAAERGVLQKLLPSVDLARLKRLQELLDTVGRETPAQTLERINIHAFIHDACQTGLRPGSVDLIFSCAVLEYVPRPVLPKLLSEFRRVASPNSAMVHWLDLVDQFHWFDPSITPFNFLQYTDAQWKWRDSPFISKSRLRISDFREQFTKAGFIVKGEENKSGSAEDLKTVRLAPRFQHYSVEDLLVLFSLITAVPNATVLA
jgi:hypothetical protein